MTFIQSIENFTIHENSLDYHFFLICLTFILLSKMCVTFLFTEENNSLLKENVRLSATNIGGMQWQICGGTADCKESPIQKIAERPEIKLVEAMMQSRQWPKKKDFEKIAE